MAALNGLLYVVGGDDGSSNLHSVEYYNPSTDTWSLIVTTMETARRYFFITVMLYFFYYFTFSYAGVAVIDRPKFFLPQKRIFEKGEQYPESDRTESNRGGNQAE